CPADELVDVRRPAREGLHPGGNAERVRLRDRLAEQFDQRVVDARVADTRRTEKKLHDASCVILLPARPLKARTGLFPGRDCEAPENSSASARDSHCVPTGRSGRRGAYHLRAWRQEYAPAAVFAEPSATAFAVTPCMSGVAIARTAERSLAAPSLC